MIRKGTRVKIIEVGEHDCFYTASLLGRTGTASSTLRMGGDDEYYYGSIKLDKLNGESYPVKPWFAYVKVEKIGEEK